MCTYTVYLSPKLHICWDKRIAGLNFVQIGTFLLLLDSWWQNFHTVFNITWKSSPFYRHTHTQGKPSLELFNFFPVSKRIFFYKRGSFFIFCLTMATDQPDTSSTVQTSTNYRSTAPHINKYN
jgi:hypothetical protein